MNKEYFTDNISDEMLAKLTDKMLKFEKNKSINKTKISLLQIIPAAAMIALVIGLINILPIFAGVDVGTNIGGGFDENLYAPVTESTEPTVDLLFIETEEETTVEAVEETSVAEENIEPETDDIQAKILKLSKELKSELESQRTYVGGEMIWPLDMEYDIISSPAGPRTSPLTKKYEIHTGYDIPAPYGSNIYAVNDGIVLIAEYDMKYGNYIVIDHGGVITTLYGQASSLLKEAGEKVKKGDVIAQVGSTGWSTGNHLHFEYAENGIPKNARMDINRHININNFFDLD